MAAVFRVGTAGPDSPPIANAGRTWLGGASAELYDAGFGVRCGGTIAGVLDRVVAAVGPRASLLDVGTGTGRLAHAARARGLVVTGIDPDLSMLTVAAEHAQSVWPPAAGADPGALLSAGQGVAVLGPASEGAARMPPVTWVQGGLPSLPFVDGTFGAAVANFVIEHVDDPVAGLTEMARVVRPGGLVAATVWRTDDALTAWFADVARAADVPWEVLRTGDETRTATSLADRFVAAGLVDVTPGELTWEMTLDADALWAAIADGVGSAGRAYALLGDSDKERYADQYRRVATEAGGLHFPGVAVCVTGKVPVNSDPAT